MKILKTYHIVESENIAIGLIITIKNATKK